ncbi:MAG: RNA polymerase sigma factor [Chloroflexota bacterium]|nr:RNA polymerase sigma factor [Chloroflexota bacterium]
MRTRSSGIEATIDSGQADWGLDQARYDRLVRYCRWLSRNPDLAQDLANDTLLEAWRNAYKLTDSTGIDHWLAAIARNMYRRWCRQAGRDRHLVRMPEQLDIAAPDDPAAACEHRELSASLSSALASLPTATRTALALRYLNDATYTEIAARTNSSEDAVSMRLSRGRAQLRHALERDMRASEATTNPHERWQETRLWCPSCGQRQQQIRFDDRAGIVSLRCPACHGDPGATGSDLPLANAHFARVFGGLRQPAAINRRLEAWVHDYFRPALGQETIACTACGAPARVVRSMPPKSSVVARNRPGMHVRCEHCGTVCSSSLSSLVLSLPEVSAFRRAHGRVRTLPVRYQQASGQPAVVLTVQSVSSSAQLDVLSARDTFELLGIHSASQISPG